MWISADWPAPENVHAGCTTRLGGVSQSPYRSLNPANHVGDNPLHVQENRQRIMTELNLPAEPVWLKQTHGNKVIDINVSRQPADGAYANTNSVVCTVLTADCLPLLLTNSEGTEISAIHIGWRGFCQDIVSSAINMFTSKPKDLLAWIGPYIHCEHYEVSEEVREECLIVVPDATSAFKPSIKKHHWLADLGLLVRHQTMQMGVKNIYGGKYCTYRDNDYFFSYRRNGITGRICSLIWLGNG